MTAPGDLASGLDATLLTAIWRLPRRQREVIALRIFLDLDTDTIAGQMRIEAGTVRMHLSRGVAALRHWRPCCALYCYAPARPHRARAPRR